jgi:hypothetical protein
MSKRAKLLTVSLALAGMVALSIGGVVLAHGPDDADAAVEDCWMQPGWGDHYGYGAICSETASELLGLTPEQIQAQRQAGKSLVEIAEAQGVSEDALIQAILAAKEEFVQEQVRTGVLTAEQAELMLQQMEQQTIEMVNRTTFGYADGRGFCGYGQPGQGTGPGAMRHWGNSAGCGAGYGTDGLGFSRGGMHGWAGSR